MPLILSGGRLLMDNGKLAASQDCCCGEGCCGCAWLETYVAQALSLGCADPPGRGRLLVTVTGAGFSGFIILGPDTGGAGECLRWATNTECGDATNLVNDCGYIVTEMEFYCLRTETGVAGFRLIYSGLTSGGCTFPNPTYQSGSCGPPLSLTYTSQAVDTGGETCPEVCMGEITFIVENLDDPP